MKKFVIILISIFLLLSSFALGFYVKKHIDDKKILYLTNEKFNLKIVNNDLISKIKKLEHRLNKNNSQKEYYNLSEYKHPIDIELEKCVESTHPYLYSDCTIENEKAWDKEIQKQLKNLKDIMNKDEYTIIINSQNDWNKSFNSSKIAINKFISKRDGTVNQTLGFSSIADLKKQRALLLEQIYKIYKDEIDVLKSSKNGHTNIAPIDFFLYDEDPKKFEIIHINKNGNAEYKGKVLYTDSGKPLNMDTAYTTTEFKVLFAAGHIEPREGCDPKDTDQNGTMGCYVDIPEYN